MGNADGAGRDGILTPLCSLMLRYEVDDYRTHVFLPIFVSKAISFPPCTVGSLRMPIFPIDSRHKENIHSG